MQKLLDNRTGKEILPETLVAYKKDNNVLFFEFIAKDSSLNSYSNKDNDEIWRGDVVEVFLDLGDDFYYEFEVAPNGTTFVAKIVNGKPLFIKNDFFKSEAVINGNDYKVNMAIDLSKFDNPKFIKFNAFRIETKGIKQDYILQALSPTMSDTFHKRDKFIEFPL